MSRQKRSQGLDYEMINAETSKLQSASVSSLEAAASIIHLAFDNPKLNYRSLSSSPDFVPILQYVALSVRRFCVRPKEDVKRLLSIASTVEQPSVAEELFIIEIFIVYGLEDNEELIAEISNVYPRFAHDYSTAQSRSKELGILEGATPKPRSAKKIESALSDKKLMGIYKKSEIEFWTLLLQYERYDIVPYFLQMVRTDSSFNFPTEFLLAHFRGSEEIMKQLEDYIQNHFANFFEDSRWFDFIKKTPRLIKFIITDVLQTLKPKEINMCGPLYDVFLQHFLFNTYNGQLELSAFVDFVVLTGDENFVNVLESSEAVASSFKQLFIVNFEDLFNNKKWAKFTEGSPIVLKYITKELYPAITIEKKNLCPGLNQLLLDNLLLESRVEPVIDFLLGLPIEFLLLQFESDDEVAKQFRDSFALDFDAYIVDDRFQAFIKRSDDLLCTIITEIVPKSQTKQKQIVQDFYELYLEKKLGDSTTVGVSVPDYVRELVSAAPTEFLKFDNLRDSLRISLFQHIIQQISPADLTQNRVLYAEFFKPFIQTRALVTIIPEGLKAAFYQQIVLPYLMNNSMNIDASSLFDLCTILVENPFEHSERPDFFNFIIQNVDELLPKLLNDDKLLMDAYNFIIANEKDLRSKLQHDVIFQVCIAILSKKTIYEAKVFQLIYFNFVPDIFNSQISSDMKLQLVLRIAQIFDPRTLELVIPEKSTRKIFREAAIQALEVFSVDAKFIQHIGETLTRENKGFIELLLGVFARDRGWNDLIKNADAFMQFITLALELYPTQTKADLFTMSRYEELLTFFSRYSLQISQNDVLRHGFLQFFLANEMSIQSFFSLLPQPQHRAVFFTEFTDPSRNSVLTQMYQSYIDWFPEGQPIALLFNVYVTAMNYQFVKVKNHYIVADKVMRTFVKNGTQGEFDNMFQRARLPEIENCLYRLSKVIGLDSFLRFIAVFDGWEPGQQNCFKEATENTILRYTPTTKNQLPYYLVKYERDRPRFRRFVQSPDLFVEFVQGLLGFGLIFYLACVSMSENLGASAACGVLGAICIGVVAFGPMYFSTLNHPGYTWWFWAQIGLIVAGLGLSMGTYGAIGRYDLNSVLVILAVMFAIVSLYKMITRVRGLPEDEYENGDPLAIT